MLRTGDETILLDLKHCTAEALFTAADADSAEKNLCAVCGALCTETLSPLAVCKSSRPFSSSLREHQLIIAVCSCTRLLRGRVSVSTACGSGRVCHPDLPATAGGTDLGSHPTANRYICLFWGRLAPELGVIFFLNQHPDPEAIGFSRMEIQL